MGKTVKKCFLNSKLFINILFAIIALTLIGLAYIFVNKINIGLSPTAIQVIVATIELFGMVMFLFKGNNL